MTLKWIWWWDPSSRELESVKHLFIVITSRSTLAWSSNYYLHLMGPCEKELKKRLPKKGNMNVELTWFPIIWAYINPRLVEVPL